MNSFRLVEMADPTPVADAISALSSSVPLVLLAIIFIAIAVWLLGRLKKILVNTILGVLVLLAINFFGKELGLQIPINFVTVLVSAIFGLAGVGAMILLSLLGIKL